MLRESGQALVGAVRAVAGKGKGTIRDGGSEGCMPCVADDVEQRR